MDSWDQETEELVRRVASALLAQSWQLACAESCTGGWISKVCTDLEGSSEWFDRGYVAYSYPAKTDLLGVSEQRLLQFGAVSAEIAADMAEGARSRSVVDVALSVTGVAGPGGGMPNKPVGTVWFAWVLPGQVPETELRHFSGDREAVRRQTVRHALEGLYLRIRKPD